jgi:hypothetical protein
MVRLTEYRLEHALEPGLSSEELLDLVSAKLEEGKGQLTESMRLTAVSGLESVAHFGRQVYVTNHRGVGQRGEPVRSIQAMQVGTILKVIAVPRDGRVELTLTYEATRLSSEHHEDLPPSNETRKINSTLLLEFGQMAIVGSNTRSSGDAEADGEISSTSTVLVVSVTRL